MVKLGVRLICSEILVINWHKAQYWDARCACKCARTLTSYVCVGSVFIYFDDLISNCWHHSLTLNAIEIPSARLRLRLRGGAMFLVKCHKCYVFVPCINFIIILVLIWVVLKDTVLYCLKIVELTKLNSSWKLYCGRKYKYKLCVWLHIWIAQISWQFGVDSLKIENFA